MEEPCFHRFLQRLDLDGEGGGKRTRKGTSSEGMHRLRSALLLVLSRIPKYQLLLDQLCKHSREACGVSGVSGASDASGQSAAAAAARLPPPPIKGAVAPSLLLPLERAVCEVERVDRFIRYSLF
jgi:hypothetical protein